MIRIYSKNTILFYKEKKGPEAQYLGAVTALSQDLDLLCSAHMEAHNCLQLKSWHLAPPKASGASGQYMVRKQTLINK